MDTQICNVYKRKLKNIRSLKCKTCHQTVHIKCNKTSPHDYKKLKENECSETWLCILCKTDAFPFSNYNEEGLPYDEMNTSNLEEISIRLSDHDKKHLN